MLVYWYLQPIIFCLLFYFCHRNLKCPSKISHQSRSSVYAVNSECLANYSDFHCTCYDRLRHSNCPRANYGFNLINLSFLLVFILCLDNMIFLSHWPSSFTLEPIGNCRYFRKRSCFRSAASGSRLKEVSAQPDLFDTELSFFVFQRWGDIDVIRLLVTRNEVSKYILNAWRNREKIFYTS